MPDWSADLLTTWSRGPISLTMHNKYIPDGSVQQRADRARRSAGYAILMPNSANTNHVSSAFYTDL